MRNEQSNSLNDAAMVNKLWWALSTAVIAIVLSPLNTYFNASIALSLYNWFLAGTPGLPALTLVNFVGISLLICLVTLPYAAFAAKSSEVESVKLEVQSQANPNFQSDEKPYAIFTKYVGVAWVSPFFVWCLGALYHWLIVSYLR